MSAAPYAPGPELESALVELERLDREASAAPWAFSDFAQLAAPVEDAQREPVVYEMPMPTTVNAETICAARNALPRLIATIRALGESRSKTRRAVWREAAEAVKLALDSGKDENWLDMMLRQRAEEKP